MKINDSTSAIASMYVLVNLQYVLYKTWLI